MKYFLAHVLVLVMVLGLLLVGIWNWSGWPLWGRISSSCALFILLPLAVERFLSAMINRVVDLASKVIGGRRID